jgi:hypothetical protein
VNTPDELKSRDPFSLAPEMLRVAVIAEFGEWSHPLADGDSKRLAFDPIRALCVHPTLA